MKTLRLGLALTGSYCTYEKALAALEGLCRRCDVTALMSENAYETDTRFGDAGDFVRRLEALTGLLDAAVSAAPRPTAALSARLRAAQLEILTATAIWQREQE